jgi:hypothetical protein
MQAIGGDRLRMAGEQAILLSAIPKGWTPRKPKTNTTAEYPGTTVLWDEQYFEVIEATAMEGGPVRYVLAPWREEHTIRTFESYDPESEARRRADFDLAKKQRRASTVSSFSGILLGHLPGAVQSRMENELGIVPSRITIASCIPPMILFGVCASVTVDATIKGTRSPIPGWMLAVTAYMMFESLLRLTVALSSGRGMGSLVGTLAYVVFARGGQAILPVRKRDGQD